MNTDNIPGVLESKVVANGFIAEIRSQAPGLVESSYSSLYHSLSARLTAKPSIAIGYFENERGSRTFSSVGNVVFHPAGVPVHSRHRIDDLPSMAVFIHFTPEKFAEMLEGEKYPRGPESMASLDVREMRIRYAMRRVADEILNPGFATPFFIESIAMSMMVHMGRYSNEIHKSSIASGGLAAWQLRIIADRLEAIDDDKVPSASELAALIDVSPRHLRRAFQASTGQGIGRYIQTIRTERAKRLLSDSALPLKEIALRLGFSAANGFTVAFVRETGITPSLYRRTYSKLPNEHVSASSATSPRQWS